MSVQDHRLRADRVAYEIIHEKQREALGRTEPLQVGSPAETLRRRLLLDQGLPYSGPASLGVYDLPGNQYWDPQKHLTKPTETKPATGGADTLRLSLLEALQVGARNNPDFQAAKEQVFLAALDLDLQRLAFRNIYSAFLSGAASTDRSGAEAVSGVVGSGGASVSRELTNGIQLTTQLAMDLAKLLTQDRSSSLGTLADATVSIPLLRGSGKQVVLEPLTRAERNVVYAIYQFERFKKVFAVRTASAYLTVLSQWQRVLNTEQAYKSLVAASRRSRRLADAGQIPEFQFDQAVQDELRARDRWVQARQAYASQLDSFKLLLGLPPDAKVELDPNELGRIQKTLDDLAAHAPVSDYTGKIPPADAPVVPSEPGVGKAGPLEMPPDKAVELALANRTDLRVARGRVEDAQRQVYVAADALRAELTLLGSARIGQRRDVSTAALPNASLDPKRGAYSGLLTLDLPIERTAERDAYRRSLVALDQAVRELQQLEDQIKRDVRDQLRNLLQARESLQTQAQAVKLAQKRVKSTDLFLQAGRAQVRDLLDAQEALLTAQNAATSAAADYRIAELALQRDLDVLQVTESGLWQEYSP